MKNEDLIRIEYKLDLIIYALQQKGLMHKNLPDLEGIQQDKCPVCKVKNKLTVDTNKGEVVRSCGCKLPMKAFKLTLITNKEKGNADNRTEKDTVSSNDEE